MLKKLEGEGGKGGDGWREGGGGMWPHYPTSPPPAHTYWYIVIIFNPLLLIPKLNSVPKSIFSNPDQPYPTTHVLL